MNDSNINSNAADSSGIKRRCDQAMRRMISRCEPGAKLPGIHALATQLGTSNVTVRLICQRLAEEGLVETRPRSGTYVTARGAACSAGEGRPIALMSVHDLLHPNASRYQLFLMSELRHRLIAQGKDARLYIGTRRPWEMDVRLEYELPHKPSTDFVRALQRDELGGVVALTSPDLDEWLPLARRHGVPVVGAETTPEVRPAIRQALRLGIRKLIAQGRRRLALLSWFDPRPGQTGELRDVDFRSFFADELRKSGLEVRPAWVTGQFHPTRRFAGADALREVWTAHREKPDGLIITDDVLARSALRAMSEMDANAWEQLSIVCHANQDDVLTAPMPVAWMRVPREPIADAMLKLLFDSSLHHRRERSRPRRIATPVHWVEAAIHSDAPADALVTARSVQYEVTNDSHQESLRK